MAADAPYLSRLSFGGGGSGGARLARRINPSFRLEPSLDHRRAKDEMDLFPPERLPIVPEATLRKHKVHEPHDTRFRSCARLLQALIRAEQQLPAGSYTTQDGRRRKLGSRLAAFPASCGTNFLSQDIARLCYRELAYREPGAMIDGARVWANMLSSMPLTFNLFGALKLNPAAAERFVESLFPDLAGQVTHLLFEHSPARGDERFTADGSAFDAFIGLKRPDGSRTFVAVEVKYAEGLVEPEPRHRPRWDDLSQSCGLYRDPDAPELRKNPLQQLWREHMLAHCLVENGLYDAGAFVLTAPKLNNDVQRGAAAYARQLSDQPHLTPFVNLTLEDAAEALKVAGEPEVGQAFIDRYLNFAPVHAVI